MINVNQSVREGALQAYFYADEVSVGTTAPMKEFSFVRTGAIGVAAKSQFIDCGISICEPVPLVSMRNNKASLTANADIRSLHDSGVLYSNYVSMHSLAYLFSSGVVHAAAPSDIDSLEVEAKLHLNKMCAFERTYSRRRALDYMYDFLEDAFFERKISMIDDVLLQACTSLIGSSLAVSFLRATSRAKAKLRFWEYYYAHVKNSLKDDPDSARILRGL